MRNDEMSREEAERWLAELIGNPERMSAKVFQEGYEASLRESGIPETEISRRLRKSRWIYDQLVEDETGYVAQNEAVDMDWGDIEILLTQTDCDPEGIHYRAAVLHHVRQLNRCLAALKTRLH
jgi:hypothetical protein